jgi:hypothetical protein
MEEFYKVFGTFLLLKQSYNTIIHPFSHNKISEEYIMFLKEKGSIYEDFIWNWYKS